MRKNTTLFKKRENNVIFYPASSIISLLTILQSNHASKNIRALRTNNETLEGVFFSSIKILDIFFAMTIFSKLTHFLLAFSHRQYNPWISSFNDGEEYLESFNNLLALALYVVIKSLLSFKLSSSACKRGKKTVQSFLNYERLGLRLLRAPV